MLTQHIFRAYDIRGLAYEDFDEAGAQLIGNAYVRYLQKRDGVQKPRIVIGRDGRLSSPKMQGAFIEGARLAGAEVTDIGLSTSPLLFFSTCFGDFDGGVNITASHNPKDYNGFKLQRRGSASVCGEEIQKIWQMTQTDGLVEAPEKGSLETANFLPEYTKKLSSLVQISGNPKVVIDCGNGVTGAFAEELFTQLGCTVVPLYTEVDGTFPNHDADPEVEENLADLKKAIAEHKADLGIAFDGDGDRVGVVDREGNHYSADLLLLLLSRDLLSRNPGAKVVIDLKATQVLFDEIARLGGEGIMVKTGHSFVEEKMKEVGALLGGEVSGHLFFAENYYGFDDAFLASGKLIQILEEGDKPMKEHFTDLPVVYNTPEIKVECPEERKFALVEELQQLFVQKYGEGQCLTIDGVRVDFGDGAWGILRASNTSPKIALRFEARTEEKLEEVKSEMMGELEWRL